MFKNEESVIREMVEKCPVKCMYEIVIKTKGNSVFGKILEKAAFPKNFPATAEFLLQTNQLNLNIFMFAAALEHANKMLLDELVSTKNESKGAIRRVESAVSDEIVNQRNISENFKSSSDFLSQLSLRVKRNEEQVISW